MSENLNKNVSETVVEGSCSNNLEIIHILGSPFWTQPLRYSRNSAEYAHVMAALKVADGQKAKTGTYKCSVPFAALCVAHKDMKIPRLPVERTAKTGFLETEIEYIDVVKGQEFVMTYLELEILGMQPEFAFTFRYDGMDNGMKISTKEHNFVTKQSHFGPNGKRLPTPSLLSCTGTSAKKKMQMICRMSPDKEPIWDTETARGRLYKERYEHMYKGHVTRDAVRKKKTNNPESVAALRAKNCRMLLESLGNNRGTEN